MVAVVAVLRRKDGKTERWKDGMVYSDGGLTTAEAAARPSVGKPTFRLLGGALATVGLAEPRVYSWLQPRMTLKQPRMTLKL